MKKTSAQNDRSDVAERKRLLRRLAIIAFVFLLPALVIWILAHTFKWVERPLEIHTF